LAQFLLGLTKTQKLTHCFQSLQTIKIQPNSIIESTPATSPTAPILTKPKTTKLKRSNLPTPNHPNQTFGRPASPLAA
jgi:hypothetical protein